MQYSIFLKKSKVFATADLAATMTLWISLSSSFFLFSFFFFIIVLILDSFILKWWAITAADLNLWYISSSSTLSCHVMTFLCFWGALPASLVALRMGPLVLFKVYSIVLNMMKNTCDLQEVTFYCDKQYWRYELPRWRWLVSHFKRILMMLELTARATGGGYKIITVVQYALELILCSYDLIQHLYICLHFSQLWMVQCMVCKCVHKFW